MGETVEMPSTQYFTVQEVAKYFKIKPKSVFTWIYRKQVNPVHIGGNVRFTLEEVRRIEKSGRGLLVRKSA